MPHAPRQTTPDRTVRNTATVTVRALFTVLSFVTVAAHANTFRWTGDAAANLNMSNPENWYNVTTGTDDSGPAAAGSSTDVLVFDGPIASARRIPVVDQDRTLNRLEFTATAEAFTFDGTTGKFDLIFDGANPALIQNSASIQSFRRDGATPVQMQLRSTLQIAGSGTGDVRFRDVISGAGGIRKIGAFNVAVDFDNTYTGPSSFVGGVLGIAGTQARLSGSAAFAFTDVTVNLGSAKNNVGLRDASPVFSTNTTFVLGAATQTDPSAEAIGPLTIGSGNSVIAVSARTSAPGDNSAFNSTGSTTTRALGGTLTINTSGDQLLSAAAGSVAFVRAGGIALQNGIVPWVVANPAQIQGGFAAWTPGGSGAVGFDEYAAYTSGPIADNVTANVKVSAGTESLAANATINSLSIDTSGGAYTLQDGAGTQLTIGGAIGGIFSKGAGAATLRPSRLTFAGEAIVFTEGAAHTLAIASPITAAALTKSLAGRLTLSGDQSGVAGSVTVAAGTLVLDGVLNHSKLRVHTGARLEGGGAIRYNLVGDAGETIDIDGTLDISALALVVNLSGAQTQREYVVVDHAHYSSAQGQIVGTAFRSAVLPAGWKLNYAGTETHPEAIVLERMPGTVLLLR